MDSDAQDLSQEQEVLDDDVNQSLSEPAETANGVEGSPDEEAGGNAKDPLFVQKRLKQQKRAHDRELRELHARIAEMQSRAQPQTVDHNQVDPYGNGAMTGGVEEQIHKAVNYALRHKEMEEAKVKQAQQAAHIGKQYQGLNKHLDDTADKYDDFDDVVRGEDVPITAHMRDAALFLPEKGAGSAGEVLYKLGKNRSELERISKLHPLEQAKEMVKLSHALISGGESKSQGHSNKILGQVKNSPVANSNAVTEKTPVSNIRERMKSGSFK